MIKFPHLILILLAVTVFNRCKAQSESKSDQSKSSVEVRADISENATKSKIELEKIYNETTTFLDSVGISEADNYKLFLTESHDGWKTYCEGKCKIIEYQSREAAQGGFAFYNLCITELNNERIAELKGLLTEWKREFGS